MADSIAHQQEQERRESEDEKRSSLGSPHPQENLTSKEQAHASPVAPKGEPTFKSRGVIGVEAMARSAATSKKGKYSLYALAVLIYILQWVVSAFKFLSAAATKLIGLFDCSTGRHGFVVSLLRPVFVADSPELMNLALAV